MNPVTASLQIEENLRGYIRRTLPMERAMPDLTVPLKEMFDKYPLAQSPYLEMLPPYKTGDSLQALVEDDIIHQKTADIFAWAFLGDGGKPADFILYSHQSAAIREVCGQDRNLIVCSGTGSGKTECFLIPIVDHLVGQWIDAGRPESLPAGVQAMILYPMNALVNDQIRRLRKIMRYAHFLTFGKYTGELTLLYQEQSVGDDLESHIADHRIALESATNGTKWSGAGFDDEAPLRNEVTRRSVWSQEPAHILVTNYSMLERLLLQPKTSNLFANPWKYIVLDEAHCYDGALGTEIAWLVRRLKCRLGNPEALRFIATSATLISDNKLTDPQKAERIRTEFASRIFPTDPSTFHVGFSDPQPLTALDNAYDWNGTTNPALYSNLLGATCGDDQKTDLEEALTDFPHILPVTKEGQSLKLMDATQAVLGAERWLGHLRDACKLIDATGDNGVLAGGDALYILKTVCNAYDSSILPIESLKNGLANQGGSANDYWTELFDADSQGNLQVLRNFLEAGIGPLHDPDKWRDWLHDYADPRPSSEPGDTYTPPNPPVGQPSPQKRYGNRLSLRKQWQKLNTMNVKGLHWLLKCAVGLATLAQDDLGQIMPDPMEIGLRFSDTTCRILAEFVDQCQALNSALQTARKHLREAWGSALNVTARVYNFPEEGSLESLLAWYLGACPDIVSLSKHLNECAKNWKKADSGRLQKAAEHLWSDGDATRIAESLAALISLASLAMPPRSSRPILDIRYHQLVRGLPSVGICFTGIDKAPVELLASDSLSVERNDQTLNLFSLGACRKCGQPFLMGYSIVQVIEPGAGDVYLSRLKSPNHKFFHAIAWKPGEDLPDAPECYPQPQTDGIWFNRLTGQVCVGGNHSNEAGWQKGYWYVRSHGEDDPEFLAECPCCGEKQFPHYNTRYGIITPYEARHDQFRLVLLDQLMQVTDPSSKPTARRYPGKGRKILAFSDSRRDAARLALNYQKLFTDTTVMRMVPPSLDLLADEPLSEAVRTVFIDDIPKAQRDFIDVDKYVAACANSRGVEPVSLTFKLMLDQNNCNRILELSAANGNDLAEAEAAKIRLLQALRKKGRQTLLRRGVVNLGSKSIDYAREHNCGWVDVQRATGLDDAALWSLCSDIHLWLFERARIAVPQNWPEEMLNPFFQRNVVRQEAEQGNIRFVTTHSRSALNLMVRQALGLGQTQIDREKARNVLDALWPLFTQRNNSTSVLTDTGNGSFRLEWEDIRILLSEENKGDEKPLPYELFDAHLAERPMVPVRIEEHTAQLSKERAAAYQRAFSGGEINILSCTTTFEMGVDLGDLTVIFLGNLPPSVANYRQRAGRAGRRPGSAAYVVSFVGNSPHDIYFFEHAAELLFGPMQAPRIYLENPIYRARHLRAEALHHFLQWMEDCGSWKVQGKNPQKDDALIMHFRKWNMAGDFFAGRKAGRIKFLNGKKFRNITTVFSQISNDLPKWQQDKHDELQGYILGMADIPKDLAYCVADDLVWQLMTQDTIRPYSLTAENLNSYQELGGPNQPEINKKDKSALILTEKFQCREIQKRFWYFYDQLGRDRICNEAAHPRASLAQGHLLNEQTIDWLSRNRVLPKYGFPSDVIRLLPNESDVHGRNVELERDLKIGLYEYAKGQEIMADKRIYKSAGAVVFNPGGIAGAVDDYSQPVHYCTKCRQPYWGKPPEQFICKLCGNTNYDEGKVIAPDAFQADRSRAPGVSMVPSAQARHNIYIGETGERRRVENYALKVAQSDTGELQYLNMGPNYQGFEQNDRNFYLYHTIKTDIAIWLPDNALFGKGILGKMQFQKLPGDRNRNRLQGAMQSALQAILHAAALVLQVADREINGELYYDKNSAGIGFVLYDESAGGGGVVTPLSLTGKAELDRPRIATIHAVIRRAIDLCRKCPECDGDINDIDDDLVPLSRAEYLNQQNCANADLYRERQSCYHCLRSYSNQRLHDFLDRKDAVCVLEALDLTR